MMIFTHKSVKIHMLGNKVKNCRGGGAQQGVVISRSILVANPLTLIERQQAVETRDMRRVGGGLIWGLTF